MSLSRDDSISPIDIATCDFFLEGIKNFFMIQGTLRSREQGEDADVVVAGVGSA